MTICDRCRELEQEISVLRAEISRQENELAALVERAARHLDGQGDQESAGLIRYALLGERKA